MTAPLHVEEATYRDVASAIGGKHQHTKLARSAAEYMFRELGVNMTPNEERLSAPRCDIATLEGFIDFLITKKNYN